VRLSFMRLRVHGPSAHAADVLRCATRLARRSVHARPSYYPAKVAIYEVGARDGLQNEPTVLDAAERTAFINMLSMTGVASVEAASFVHPKLVPQMAGAAEIMQTIRRHKHVAYPVLVPNRRGYDDALKAGSSAVAVMCSASNTFAQRNVKQTMQQQVEGAVELAADAVGRGVPIRGYISCALGCPFEGAVPVEVVVALAKALADAGCDEVVLADTIGTGTPGGMAALLASVQPQVPVERLAVHCHDTYGQALANILVALQHGVASIDSSVAGLGGCPFAGPGAAGNVATEDVLYMLHGLGIETGVDFDRVVLAGEYIIGKLGRGNASKAAVASLRRRPNDFTAATARAAAST